VPGRAVVYRGASPVQEEPFSFEKYCARSTSTTGRFDTLSQPPTVSQLEDFIRGLTADDCMPGMEEELLGVAPTTELTCYGLNTNTRIADNESARCPSGRYSAGPILGALVPIVLTGVTSTDDISLIVHSAAYEIRRWPGPNDACSVASVEQIEPNNATCYMNILNWDGSTCGTESFNTIRSKEFPDVAIPGCGVGCDPYSPASVVLNNDCDAAHVPSGTTCNIQCPEGQSAVGSPVSCQAGRYIGDIICSGDPVALLENVRNDTTFLIDDANLDQILTVTGPGCGDRTAVGTTCHITCSYGHYSTGTVVVQIIDGRGATWIPSPNAGCHPTTCGTGTAIPVEGRASIVDGTELMTREFLGTEFSGGEFLNPTDLIIRQPGCNFDPASDKVILIPREPGSNGGCGSTEPVANAIFSCATSDSNNLLLHCTAPPGSITYSQLPLYSQICVCDADFEKGCTSASQFSKIGGIADASASPTHVPTATPTTASPTAAPSGSPTTMSPTSTPSVSPTSAAPSATPTSSPSNPAADRSADNAHFHGGRGMGMGMGMSGSDGGAIPIADSGTTTRNMGSSGYIHDHGSWEIGHTHDSHDQHHSETRDHFHPSATNENAREDNGGSHSHGMSGSDNSNTGASSRESETDEGSADNREDEGSADNRQDDQSSSASNGKRGKKGSSSTAANRAGSKGKKGTSSTAADRVGSQGKKGKGTAAYTVVHSQKSLATTSKWSGLSALVGVGLVLGGILVVTYRRRSAYRLLEEEASAKHPTESTSLL